MRRPGDFFQRLRNPFQRVYMGMDCCQRTPSAQIAVAFTLREFRLYEEVRLHGEDCLPIGRDFREVQVYGSVWHHSESTPLQPQSRIVRIATSVRFVQPNFLNIRPLYTLIVPSSSFKSLAISLLTLPNAINRQI